MTATRQAGLFLAVVIVLATLVLPPLAEAAPADETSVCIAQRHDGSTTLIAQSLSGARWDVGAIQAQWTHRAVWQVPVTGAGVRVAVLDTGVDATHPDLAGKVVAWRDFVHDRAQPYDDDGHGTQVAGVVAAGGHLQLRPLEGYFPFGARGIAPESKIIAGKIMEAGGEGDAIRIAQAVLWALDPDGDGDPADGANIINLSLGVALPPPPTGPGMLPAATREGEPEEVHVLADAIRTAVNAGAVVVVSAGNHQPGAAHAVTFPGTMKEVITVGATDARGKIAAFSNEGRASGAKPDLVAPGVLYTTASDGGYVGAGGTSLAAPLVAGAVALLMEVRPELTAISLREDRSQHTETVRELLTTTARPLADTERALQGAGLLRIDAALAAAGTGTPEALRSEVPYFVMAMVVLPFAARRHLVRRRRRLRERRDQKATDPAARERPGVPLVVVPGAAPPPAAAAELPAWRGPIGPAARPVWAAPHHAPHPTPQWVTFGDRSNGARPSPASPRLIGAPPGSERVPAWQEAPWHEDTGTP